MKKSYSISDFYKEFKSEVDKYDLSKNEFLDLMYSYFKYLSDELLDKGTITLPGANGYFEVVERLGTIRLNDKGEIINKMVDWHTTNQLWKKDEKHKLNKTLIYHLNDHTNGRWYRIKWFKNNITHKNIGLYKYKPCRTLARQLAQNIKLNLKEY